MTKKYSKTAFLKWLGKEKKSRAAIRAEWGRSKAFTVSLTDLLADKVIVSENNGASWWFYNPARQPKPVKGKKPTTQNWCGTKPPSVVKKTPKVYIAIVLDDSASMSGLAPAAQQAFNDAVQTIREKAQGQDVRVSYFTFGSLVRAVFHNEPVQTLKPRYDYRPNQGSTALVSGVVKAVKTLEQVPDANESHVSFLVITITDGEENHSGQADRDLVKQLLKDKQATDHWTFAFQVPPNSTHRTIQWFGVPTGNIQEWETTTRGAQIASVQTANSLGNYLGSTKAGITKSTNFYTTDLSKLTTKAVTAKLDDISDRFKEYTMVKEETAKEFVESKTKKGYVIGQLYYQLMKTEKIQPTKQILIQEKGKKAVWGGQQARDLIGLPVVQEVKVKPGNHANFDVFVQSCSVNRKLPRGTRILIDLTQTTSLTPTWDHTTPEAQARLAAQGAAR